MSIVNIEHQAFADEPFGGSAMPTTATNQSAESLMAAVHYENFFASHPALAQKIWDETAMQILASDFDPRAAYLEAFNNQVARRTDDVEVYDDNGEEVITLLPTQPTDEVLLQLGTTSLYLHDVREYYNTLLSID